MVSAGARSRWQGASLGKAWYHMRRQKLTPELLRDQQLLRLRGFMDPKQFYKGGMSTKRIPKHFEMGVVVEGPTEFKAARLSKRERQASFAREVLHDPAVKQHTKRRFDALQEANMSRFARKRRPPSAGANDGPPSRRRRK